MLEDFFKASAGLKKIPRQGWIDKGPISNPESVADHTYSACMMAMVLGDLLGLDTQKMMRMALLHDLPESTTGDIIPGQMDSEEKKSLEDRAMHDMLEKIPAEIRDQYAKVWSEFSDGSTPEARLMHEIDGLEMALQASIYAKNLPPESLAEFFKHAKNKVSTIRLKEILESLEEQSKNV